MPVANLHIGGGAGAVPNAMPITGADLYVRGNIEFDGKIYGDGSALTGVGGVSGLTVNRVPVASSPTTLVDSMIYSVGNNVGVGTSAPRAQLHVGAGAPSMIPSTVLGANDAFIKGRLEVDSTVYINGNVGIGTTVVDTKLTIGQSADSNGFKLVGYDDMSSVYEKISIDSLGIVHFDTPGYTYFDVSGSLAAYISSAGIAVADFKDFSLGTWTNITLTFDGTNFAINPRSAAGHSDTANTVFTSGNVGIGTGAPVARLVVVGEGAATGRALEIDNSLYNPKLVVFDNGNVGLGTTAPVANLHVGAGVPSMTLSTGLGANDALIKGRLEVDSSVYINASVGVGTTAPQQKLEVRGGAILGSEFSITTAASMTADWSNGNQQYVALNQAGHTINLSNYKVGQILRLVVCQDGTGGRTVTTWDASIVWTAGTAPTLTSGANKCDVVSFICTYAKGSVKNFGAVTANF